MPDSTAKGGSGASKSPTERAIADIVKMNPRRVTVTLTLPVADRENPPTVTLEWTREDPNMPLSDLLKRLETYSIDYSD